MTEAGTFPLLSGEGIQSFPGIYASLDGMLCFAFGRDFASGGELWKSDGTVAGTTLVTNAIPGNPYNLDGVDAMLFLTVSTAATGTELWKSDGTPGGTALLKDLWPGTNGSEPYGFAGVNDTVLFFARDDAGEELWRTDGTAAGNAAGEGPAAGRSRADVLGADRGGRGALLRADAPATSGDELWRSDGSDAGTLLVKDISPGTSDAAPSFLTNVAGTLLFSATDGTGGRELWRSDGTPGGTALVKEIAPGAPAGASPPGPPSRTSTTAAAPRRTRSWSRTGPSSSPPARPAAGSRASSGAATAPRPGPRS